jgi:hypothetical protein
MRSLRRLTALALLSCSLSLTACGANGTPCRGDPNMVDPRLIAGIESDATGPSFRVTWDPPRTGEAVGLTDDYFAEVVLSDPSSPLATSAGLTGEREITVRLDRSRIVAGTHSITLLFPDHRDAIGCTHPGMPDRYLLDITLVLDDLGVLTRATLTQRVQLGPI